MGTCWLFSRVCYFRNMFCSFIGFLLLVFCGFFYNLFHPSIWASASDSIGKEANICHVVHMLNSWRIAWVIQQFVLLLNKRTEVYMPVRRKVLRSVRICHGPYCHQLVLVTRVGLVASGLSSPIWPQLPAGCGCLFLSSGPFTGHQATQQKKYLPL